MRRPSTIDDLPEDTQNRLNEGIGQASMDAARATLSQYRTQIDADRTKAAQNAAAIEGSPPRPTMPPARRHPMLAPARPRSREVNA